MPTIRQHILRLAARMMLVLALLATALIYGVQPAAANPRVTTVGVASQVGALTAGTAGSVTFFVTVTKANSGTNNTANTVTANLSFSGLPTGASGSFSPASLTWTGTAQTGPKTATLTINTTALAAAGSTSFAVTATRSGTASDNTTANGTLTIAPASTAGGVSYDLYATTGTLTLPGGGTVPIWGYSTSATSGSATLPGPTIVVTQGTVLTVNLHNNLAESSSLHFDAQSLPSDATGAAAGAVKSYTFTASNPGTFLYEAGLKTDGNRQVAMGMFGALIVRPATAGQAYNASTLYDDEAVLVISEVDPALNAAPTAFDMRKYAPKYWLVNGKAYPSTANINTAAGRKVLLRYLNAGIRDHGVGVLGMHQNVIATGGHALTYPYQVIAETIPAGATLDTIATIPAGAPAGAKFALYNAAMHLDNAGPAVAASTPIGFGGMLAFLNVTTGTTTGDTAGPLSSSLLLTPSTTNGSADVAITASVSDNSTGGSTVQAARYYIDSLASAPVTMAGSFGATTASVNGAITVAQMAALTSGQHTIYVQGQDALNNWGPANSVLLTIDKTGPTTSMVLTPSLLNASATVSLQVNGDDTASGGSNVIAAEYTVDGGAAISMGAPNQTGPAAAFSVTFAAPTTPGAHTIQARTQDALGNWSALQSATLTVDTTAPGTTNVVASPNPNNGAQSSPSATLNSPAIRVDATFIDPVSAGVQSAIAAAEGFIDININAPPANGTGFAFQANDGLFNSPSEAGYGLAPLSTISLLSNGTHTLYVHAKDAAGNWGPYATGQLIIDRAAPVLTAASVSPTTSPGVSSVTLTTTANDPAAGGSPTTGIAAVEWFEGADPGVGNGNVTFAAQPYASPSTLNTPINVSALTSGAHTLSVRVRDAAGNWSNLRTVTLTIDRLFASAFNGSNTQPFDWSSANGTARLAVVAAANMDGNGNGLQVTLSGTGTGYVVGNLPPAAPNNANVTSYHARFYVNPNGANINPANLAIPPTPTIFAAMSGGNRSTTVFQVQMRRTSAGQYQVCATNTSACPSTRWVNISGTTTNAIEVIRSGTALTLYVGGTLQTGSVTVANTNLTAARLGFSAGLATGMSGTVYFDAFVSTRNLLIGL